ncbi:hypothetical protein KCP75_17050 [Salmonella enterica subsp. enterica]|nr:hypothetical protein KCP75_17050 [Salmonella enterica subsp. enterica]
MLIMWLSSAMLIFAVDSIPAIFAVTTDPFIVLTSNLFAILGLCARCTSCCPAWRNALSMLKYGRRSFLVFIGIKDADRRLLPYSYHLRFRWA